MMLEGTREQFTAVTNAPDAAHAHLARYLFVTQLVAGQRVLVVGSGEG